MTALNKVSPPFRHQSDVIIMQFKYGHKRLNWNMIRLNLLTAIFWDVIPCSLVYSCWSFEECIASLKMKRQQEFKGV
jgi:hypothetical protein